MTEFFKNARIFLFAVTLSASCCGIANAQVPIKKQEDPKKDSDNSAWVDYFFTPEKKVDSTSSVKNPNFRLSIVTEDGKFKNEFKTFREAFNASEGNSYNKILREGSEIIVMNTRCGEGYNVDITFSLFEIPKDLSPIINSYSNFTPKGRTEAKTAEGEMIDKVMKTLAISRFPQKAVCDAIPVALSIVKETQEANGIWIKSTFANNVIRLEADDAQNPLIGTKYNDGTMYDAWSNNSQLMAHPEAKTRKFWEKFGHNSFTNAQDAVNIAAYLAGTKTIISNGKYFSIYRLSASDFPENPDYSRNFDILKTTPMTKGWIILAVLSGNKLVKIYDPETQKK